MNELSVYSFIDYRKFLSEYFLHEKRRKPRFSHRYFCEKAGFKTPSVIKLVIDGKRNLSQTSIAKISRALGLSSDEHTYFTALVMYNQTKSSEEKRNYLFKLSELRGESSPVLVEKSKHNVYKEWYNTVVRECLDIPNLSQSPQLLAKRILPPVSPEKIRESIDLLEKSGLIEKDENGTFRIKDQVITTEDELDSEFVANFNREMIQIALRASLIIPKQKREISGVTLRISSNCFKEIKKRIVNFKKELLYLARKDEGSDQLYQLNLQLFPLLSDD